MAKINIQITKKETGFLRNNEEKIAEIEINCGNWKYWDNHMECEPNEKISLTMNNIYKARYLALPVKDAIADYDLEAYKENREIIITGASVRTYDSLHEYLCHRINNAKESCLKDHEYTAVLFDETFKKHCEDTVVNNIVYEQEGMITVKITKENGIE